MCLHKFHSPIIVFNFSALTVENGVFGIQSILCTEWYLDILNLRTWEHICVVFGDNPTLYVQGAKKRPDAACTTITGWSTSAVTLVTAGIGNRRIDHAPDIQIADLRVYSEQLNNSDINAVLNFFDASISNIFQTSSKNIIQITDIENQTTIENLIFVDSTLSFNNSQQICLNFGGNLIPATNEMALLISVAFPFQTINMIWVKGTNTNCYAAKYSDNLFNTTLAQRVAKCDKKYAAVCSTLNNYAYKFIGEIDGTTEVMPVYFEKFSEQFVYFVTDRSFYFAYDRNSKIFSLYDSDNGINSAVWQTQTKIEFANLIGRYNWISQLYNSLQQMTFSSCAANQFTCSNGNCIPLVLMCNFHSDCSDHSDEIICNHTASRPTYYNRQLSSLYYDKNNPTQLGVEIALENIPDVDIINNIVTIQLKIVVTWRDLRQTFLNLQIDTMTSLAKADIDFMWQPTIVIENAQEEAKFDMNLAEKPGNMSVIADGYQYVDTFDSYEGKFTS